MSLLHDVQKNLGYAPLIKIDITTDAPLNTDDDTRVDKFGQAAIPAILIGIYEYSKTEIGAEELLKATAADDWMLKIFAEKRKQILEAILTYNQPTLPNPMQKLEAIADEAIMLINEAIGKDADSAKLISYLEAQKTEILLYLLPDLQMGVLLNNTVLDDDINKMEGPISSLMKNIGGAFSNHEAKTDLEKKEANF